MATPFIYNPSREDELIPHIRKAIYGGRGWVCFFSISQSRKPMNRPRGHGRTPKEAYDDLMAWWARQQ